MTATNAVITIKCDNIYAWYIAKIQDTVHSLKCLSNFNDEATVKPL